MKKIFKELIMDEIFLNKDSFRYINKLVEDNFNIYSIEMIKKDFGTNYSFKCIRTYHRNWENKKKYQPKFK